MWTRSSSRGQAALTALALAASAAHAQHPLEEVRVVATPHDQAPGDVAQSITVLAGERLARNVSNTLGETLAAELGVSSTQFGSGASRPVIRGLAGARVKVLEDGIDALDVSSVSADHAVGIDPIAAQQIEIFRGPTTLLYGSGAVGGVVNTVTNRIPAVVPEDGLAATIALRGDTVAAERSAALALDGGRDRLAWHVDASRRAADDYEIPGMAERGSDPAEDEAPAGVVPNSDFDTGSGAVGVAWLGDRSSFGIAVSRFSSDYGVPGHSHGHGEAHGEADHGAEGGLEPHDHADHGLEPDAHGENVRVDLDATRIDLRADWLGLARFPQIALRLGINDYRHLEMEGGHVATRFRNDAYEARVEVLHSPWGEWNGAFGAAVGGRELEAVGDEAFVPPVETRSFGAFLLEDRDFGRWRTSLGARLEHVRHRPFEGPSASDTAASVSAAAIRRLPQDVSLALNLALAERVPAAEELYAAGPHLASSTFEVWDPTLGVETSRHIDLGVRRSEGRVAWAVTVFRTEYDDFVYLAATGADDESSGLPIFRHVQADAELVGFEAELFARIADVGRGEIDARLYGDRVRATLADGTPLPRIPPERHGLRIQYHDERILAGIEAVRHDDVRDTAPFESPTRGYALLGFDIAMRLGGGDRRTLELLIKGTNLLNEEARKHTSIVKDLAPLPGRSYSLGLRASF